MLAEQLTTAQRPPDPTGLLIVSLLWACYYLLVLVAHIHLYRGVLLRKLKERKWVGSTYEQRHGLKPFDQVVHRKE